MVLFKVAVEEKIPEPPKPAKKPEPAVVPPKEEPTKKEKGTFMFLMDLSSVTDPGFVSFCFVCCHFWLFQYDIQLTMVLLNHIIIC